MTQLMEAMLRWKSSTQELRSAESDLASADARAIEMRRRYGVAKENEAKDWCRIVEYTAMEEK